MCGIVGYIGFEDAKEIILNDLEKLEYRGYDSAGIAIAKNNTVNVIKEKGRINELRQKVDKDITGNLGIGHTRWATHGVPNRINSHPHQSSSKRFTIVHNGIIENEAELRDKFLKNTTFISDTDTEVIVQMIEKFVKDGESVQSSIRHTIKLLRGSYALAVIDNEDMDTIYAAKNKTPLLAGKGGNFNMIASDAMAMINHTNTFYEIEDKEFLIITRDDINIYSLNGHKVMREPFSADINISDIEKGTYAHYMLKEIEEQPFVIRKIISKYSDGKGNISVEPTVEKNIKDCDKLYMIACGTSYHAGLIGKYIFEKIVKKPAEVILASEFTCNMPLLSKNPLFIFISQSGETADLREVLVNVKKMGYKTLTLTNVKGSTLYREADNALLLHAGHEIAVASTKAYTAQVAVLAIVASLFDNSMDIFKELSKTANVMETLCGEKEKYKMLAENYLVNSNSCFYIGRGVDYYLCLEASLKLKEISYIHSEGFAAGELKHGTIALIEKNTPVIAVITQENVNLKTRSNIKETEARGASVIVISSGRTRRETDQIIIDDMNELLSPLAAIIPAQYIAYYAALLKGCDIDKPRNLAKSVTVE